jgi:hypothetical protein
VSRGFDFDAFEMDDFRDSHLESESYGHPNERGTGRGSGSQSAASVRVALAKLREAEHRSDQLGTQNHERRETSQPCLTHDSRALASDVRHGRTKIHDRDKTYSLQPSELRTLTDIGKFRVVSVEDLEKLSYAGDHSRLDRDLRNLTHEKLVERRGTSVFKKDSQHVLTLTKRGERLVRGFLPDDQAVYSGFAKPKEAEHDASLYRLYHKVADEIERKGGKVLRVHLDYELKENLYRKLGRAQAQGNRQPQRSKVTFAHELHLPVVNGKVSFPDLRIEHATQEMEIARVDLELATGHYHAGHLAEKARAGFQIYARSEDAAGLRRVRDDREIMTAILSL